MFNIVPSKLSFTLTVNDTSTVWFGSTVTIHLSPNTALLFSSNIFSGSLISSPAFNDSNVVFSGILSVTSIFSTAFVPLLVIAITYVIVSPAYTRFGLSALVFFTYFSTIKSGASTSILATVDAIAISVGVHQSQ